MDLEPVPSGIESRLLSTTKELEVWADSYRATSLADAGQWIWRYSEAASVSSRQSNILIGAGLRAVEQGLRVRYSSAADLVKHLSLSLSIYRSPTTPSGCIPSWHCMDAAA